MVPSFDQPYREALIRTRDRTMSVCPLRIWISVILLVTCWFLATHWGAAPRPCLESDVSLARNLRNMAERHRSAHRCTAASKWHLISRSQYCNEDWKTKNFLADESTFHHLPSKRPRDAQLLKSLPNYNIVQGQVPLSSSLGRFGWRPLP